jgi:glutamate-1-semialdehyde 2,1-aminomutase
MGTQMPVRIKMNRTQELYQHARRRIPGGTQLLSKRPEMFAPEQWPAYFSKAKGVETWDLDGNKYIDMSMSGIGACVLGFADPDVDAAVKEVINNGSMCTLNSPEEVELADLLCELHPWAEMVRYARCGGESMVIAVRIARAHTRRDKVAFCGYHGWHDWYLAANLATDNSLDGHLLPGLEPAGVPRGLIGTALPFRYNHLDDLHAIVSENKDELAAIVMEPIRDREPEPGFLESVREIADKVGAVMIFDEVSSGLRLNCGGAHLLYGVNPDIAVFAKGMGNGYPMGAIIGVGRVMQAAQTSFISSTYWTERIGPTAALATIRKFRELAVEKKLNETGKRIQEGWKLAAKRAKLDVCVSGIPPLSHLSFNYENGQMIATLFTQLMLVRGFLASKGFYSSYAHQDEHVKNYLDATTEVFGQLSELIQANEIEKHLKGPEAHTGFRRLA